jgi:hypothetical protein
MLNRYQEAETQLKGALTSFCREIGGFELGQVSYSDFIGITVLPCG